MIRSYKDFDVFQRSYSLAMTIFKIAANFPTEEKYSLTSQLIRSSRSVSANIAEGWAKRNYEKKFRQHLVDALGSNTETEVWLSFALDCNYLNKEDFNTLTEENTVIGKMLTKLHQNWKS